MAQNSFAKLMIARETGHLLEPCRRTHSGSRVGPPRAPPLCLFGAPCGSPTASAIISDLHASHLAAQTPVQQCPELGDTHTVKGRLSRCVI